MPLRGIAEAPLEALFGEDNEAICGALRARKVQSVKELAYVAAWELKDWLLIPEPEAEAILARSWAACACQPNSAYALAQNVDEYGEVPPPLPSLQVAFGGSLKGSFVEVAGPPGVGKTQFCLQAAASTSARGGEVFWLDTERTFSPQRLLELLTAQVDLDGRGSQDSALQALEHIRCRTCSSLPELQSAVQEIAECAYRRERLPSLLIVDSIAAAARHQEDVRKRQAALNQIASNLKSLVSSTSDAAESMEASCPAVIVTNQVSGDPTSAGYKVALGHMWHHAVNWRLILRHESGGSSALHGPRSCQPDRAPIRTLVVEKSPCCGPQAIPFFVTSEGLREIA
uniref:DNA repair protein RAD51-like protein 2 n=1 Tax=Crypthecodinium cohnii TaxID=2866 RepID=A0A516AGL3_CRYCO|nr:DNA repair protein RAD51-like protein 2 [Crypthecodinium cohnii]USW07893.1 DNA repair protein RAD51-like protein 2 [Crypthecodinium cohnii]